MTLPLGLAVHAMREAAILVNKHGCIEEVSPAFEALSGFTEAELIGKTLASLQVAEAFDLEKKRWQGKPPDGFYDDVLGRRCRYRRQAGGFFWGETFDLPVLDQDGKLGGHCHIVRDASKRVRRADGLMALISYIADQSVHLDHDMSILLHLGCDYFDLELGLFCRSDADSDRVESRFGCLDLEEALGCLGGADRLSELVRLSGGMIVNEHAGQSPQRHHPLCTNAGLETWLACSVRGDGRDYGTLFFADRRARGRRFDHREKQVLHFIAHWIATRKDIEAARSSYDETTRLLAKSEERYRSLYEKTPAMLHSIDGLGRLIHVSDRWLQTLGYERDEVIGRPSTDFLTDESKRYAIDVVLPAYRATGRCDDIQYQFVAKNGDTRDIVLSAISQHGEHGAFGCSLAVLLDVTERVCVEQTLENKTKALERSSADLARFAQIASHDLQEPLRRIITYCQILAEDFGADLPKEAFEITRVIQSGGRHLRLMINDLLSYVRLHEQFDRDFEPVDMSAILSHALDDLHEEIKTRSAQVRAETLPLVWGRAPLLKMVLHHLLKNAITYGGHRSPAIDVSVEDGGDVWRFAIADDGIGVEPRFADRIFEIFQKLDRKDVGEGSGSGLAICRLVVQRCGGEIWLDRSYQNGARFLFTLPKTKPTIDDVTIVSPEVALETVPSWLTT
jgi:PAS domain S-box-containing protein